MEEESVVKKQKRVLTTLTTSFSGISDAFDGSGPWIQLILFRSR